MATVEQKELWYEVKGLPNGDYWTMDEEDVDLAYVESAIVAWQTWRDFIIREKMVQSDD